VRSVCEVFALDASAADETALMRRNLLALVGCRPFSSAAAFRVRMMLEHILIVRDDACRLPPFSSAAAFQVNSPSPTAGCSSGTSHVRPFSTVSCRRRFHFLTALCSMQPG